MNKLDPVNVAVITLMFAALLIYLLPPSIMIQKNQTTTLKQEVDRLRSLNKELIDMNLSLIQINKDNTNRLTTLMTAVQSIYGEKQKVQNVTIQPPTTKKKTAD